MGFSMLGMPAIDGYFATPVVTAVVTWTLPYEITFYMLLPLLALPLCVFMPATTLALGLAAAIWLAALAPEPMKCLPFVGGMEWRWSCACRRSPGRCATALSRSRPWSR
jgi:peptidoglycan/LPS O-acetylase OafA/YrhL